MDRQTKRISTVLITSVIAISADIVMYSIGASSGKSLRIHIPKGRELIIVLVVAIITGLIVDFIAHKVIESQKTEQEKALEKLKEADLEKLDAGELKTAGPIKIIWAPAA